MQRSTRPFLPATLLLVSLILGTSAAPAAAVPRPWPVAASPTSVVPVGTWPLRPVPTVVRGFDPPASAWGAGHRGVDLLARPGQGVLAALPGTVTYAGVLAGRGVVVVSHGSSRTTYEPVAAAVRVGDPVEMGDRLGSVEAAPSHCAPRSCLHWGWVEGETYLDPLRLVGQGPVRLLPLSLSLPLPSSPPVPEGTTASGGPPLPAWW